MVGLAVWFWLMHFIDMCFQILPIYYPQGISLDKDGLIGIVGTLGSMAFIGGCLARLFIKSVYSHPAFPQQDPRIAEAMETYVHEEGLVHEAGVGSVRTGGGH
jgi:hypothetical protein